MPQPRTRNAPARKPKTKGLCGSKCAAAGALRRKSKLSSTREPHQTAQRARQTNIDISAGTSSNSSTTVGIANNGQETEGITRATIGQGNISVRERG